MQENLKEDIIIRDMQESDVSLIILSAKEQGKSLDVEKFYSRIEEQSQGKNFALVAEYKGEIAGYVFVYPYSHNGLFKDENYTEVVDFTVFKKNNALDVEGKLMGAVEKIAADYSDILYISVAVHDWESLDFFIKRCYMPHKSGIWKKSDVWHRLEDKSDDNLVFWLYKVNKSNSFRFTIINTFERPYLRWLQEGLKTAIITVNTEDRQRIKIGDEIIVTDRENLNYVKGLVTFRREYNTIRDVLKFEGVKNICPFWNEDDLEKCVQMYQSFSEFHYEKKYGCVALGINVVESQLRW